jgi:hypothetical protein
MTGPPLFISYGGGHSQIALRLWQALRDRHGIRARVLALTMSAPDFAAAGIPVLRVGDFLTGRYADAAATGAGIIGDTWSPDSPVSHAESCAYHGVSMLDLIDTLGEDEARARFEARGRAAFWPVRFLTHVLSSLHPAVTITTCHARMEGASVHAARLLGIPSLRVDDLFGYTVLGPGALDQPTPAADPGELPDHIVVLNRAVARLLTGGGVPPQRLYPLGQPVFSDLTRRLGQVRPDPAVADWAADGRRFAAIFPRPEDSAAEIGLAARLLLARPGSAAAVKLHPTVRKGSVDDPGLPNLRILDAGDVLAAARHASVSIAGSTTVSLTLALAGLPLVVPMMRADRVNLPFDQSPATRIVRDDGAWIAAAADFLDRRPAPMHAATRAGDLFENPPGAANAIADLIATLASGNQPVAAPECSLRSP